jgi:hypothetical protein
VAGVSDEDAIRLRRKGDRSFFHEAYTATVDGVELRDLELLWATDSGRADFELKGQLKLPGIDQTSSPIVTYGFSAPIVADNVPQLLSDSTDVTHEVSPNLWMFVR